MYLKNIQLTNFGSYKGYNKIDLTTTNTQNVILFGGKNGAGKTTLLNAIKIGLFGSYALRYRTDNQEYFTYIKTLLNNDAQRNAQSSYSITLQFLLEDEFEEIHYELKREWFLDNEKVRENLFLLKEGKVLTTTEIDIFFDKLKEILPPQLLEIAFFDGEEISRVITENQLANYLKEITNVVFNLELFKTLEQDLTDYSKKNTQTQDQDKLQSSLMHQLNEKEKLQLNNQFYSEQLFNKIKNRDQLKAEYENLKKEFENYGGLVKQKREHLQQTIAHKDMIRKQRHLEIKEFISTSLPLFLMAPLIEDTKNQIIKESNLQLAKKFKELIITDDLSDILKKLDENTTIDAAQLQESIQKLLIPDGAEDHNEKVIHNASLMDTAKIEQASNMIKADSVQAVLQMIEDNHTDLLKLRELRRILKINDETHEFNDTIKLIEKYQQKILQMDFEIKELEEKVETIQTNLENVINQVKKIQSEIKDIDKTTNSFFTAQKIIALSQRYREIQTRQKLKDIQTQATININNLLQKEDYINQIIIDPETFDISLYDRNNQAINMKLISAGEKQILLLSIIWAIFKVSKKKIPFVLDTLLGRLDQTHRSTLLTSMIPNFGEQVIILSTDSEINKAHYQLLKPVISKEYTLKFNTSSFKTEIQNSYFELEKEI